MDLESVFQYTAEKMKLEWAQIKKSLNHSGNKGTSLEKTVQEFLRPYLPKTLGITSGEVTDSDGNSTKQLDIIIYDEAKTPVLFAKGDIRVIPIECVYAIIEVKANISSQEDVDQIFENMKSVKNLEKTAYYETLGAIKHQIILYGKELDIWPIHYFVFAIDSMNIETLANKINQKHLAENCEVTKRIDCMCILEKGIIMNESKDGKYSALPQPESVITFHESENPLLFFYTLISRYLNQAWMPNFNFTKFMKNVSHRTKSVT